MTKRLKIMYFFASLTIFWLEIYIFFIFTAFFLPYWGDSPQKSPNPVFGVGLGSAAGKF